ncbi:MAG: hypothetical protein HZC41_09390 [Chloroflexi bacterium]|nr:hypothetical protein [Chloroflexota bacterium]
MHSSQDDFSWVVGAQPVYVLPDPSRPVLLWVDSLPVTATTTAARSA